MGSEQHGCGRMTVPATTDAGVPDDVDNGSRGIQIFSAPSDAPRVRWRTDLISAGFTSALLIFVIIVAGEGSSLDRNTLEFVGDLPGWLRWLGQAAYVVGVLYSVSLLIGVLIGVLFLGETCGRIRLIATLLVLAGAALIRLG